MSFQNCTIKAVGVDPADYHKANAVPGSKDFVMSSSALRDFGFCPRKWIHSKPDEGSSFTDYGNLLETLVLLPETFSERYAIQPATYDRHVLKCPQCGSATDSKTCRSCKCDRVPAVESQEWSPRSETCQQWIKDAEAAGLRVVEATGTDKRPGLAQAQEAQKRLASDPIARAFLDSSEVQVHVIGEWHDEPSGLTVPCQCLIDLAPRVNFTRCLGDLKTARSAYPPFWCADSRTRGYNVQAAWNLAMWNAATGKRPSDDGYRDTFCFIISENTHPWEIGLEMMAEAQEGNDRMEKLDYGRVIYESWMAWYCQCLAKNHFPGYDEGPDTVQGWSIDRGDSRDEAAAMRAMSRKPSIQEQLEAVDEFVSEVPT